MTDKQKESKSAEDWKQKLFRYMSKEHNVTLLDSDMNEIENIINPKTYPYNPYEPMISINKVLEVLQENYQAAKKINVNGSYSLRDFERDNPSSIKLLIETYEDLISIFNHQRNLPEAYRNHDDRLQKAIDWTNNEISYYESIKVTEFGEGCYSTVKRFREFLQSLTTTP